MGRLPVLRLRLKGNGMIGANLVSGQCEVFQSNSSTFVKNDGDGVDSSGGRGLFLAVIAVGEGVPFGYV